VGKAKIISGGTGGLYNIELTRNTAKITAIIATIIARLASLTTAIEDALAAKNAAEADLSTKRAALDEAIGKLILKQITAAAVNTVQRAFLAALTAYESKRIAWSLLLQEQESKTKRKILLESVALAETRNSIWCADLTENLAAGEEVGTIEIDGEDSEILIYPGGEWDNLPGSLLQPVLASTPAGAFYNQAILPGWQRFKPTYRTGTITAISGDLCTVSIDETFSAAQDLNINITSGALSLSNVPIEYMSYNGTAFAVGDDVVVEFTDQDWTKPKVIGFVHDPRIPGADYYKAFLSLYQDQKIGRVDDFPDSMTVKLPLVFAVDDCDIIWSYRSRKYIVACASWVKLVGIDGTVSKTYALTGTEGIIFLYTWQPTRELLTIRTGPTSYIQLDHDLNLITPSSYFNFAGQDAWRFILPSNPWPMEKFESWCNVGSNKYVAVVHKVNWTEIASDMGSGYWAKSGETYDHEYGEPVSYQDPHIIGGYATTPEYSWSVDYKLFPYTSAELRLYTRSAGTYEVLRQLPMFDYDYVNKEVFDTVDGIYANEGMPPSWTYRKFHYEIGECQKTLKTCGAHQKVTYYDPDGGPAPDDYPTANGLIILANSGTEDILAPSITVFDMSGNLVSSIVPPSLTTDGKININYPQKYPVTTSSTSMIAWYDFLQRHPDFALGLTTEETEIPSTAQLLADLAEINAFVNTTYPADLDPTVDYWEFISIAGHGDCEDYALEKAKLLLAKGYPANGIHLETGNIKNLPGNPGHAWLVILTSAGVIVLDNLHPAPVAYTVTQTEYENRARQTGMYWYYVE